MHEDRILEKPNSFDEAHEFIDGYGRRCAALRVSRGLGQQLSCW